MAKPKQKSVKQSQELDGVFFLKLVFYMIIGSLWLKVQHADFTDTGIPIPVGLIIGLLFARHEHFQIDRKIEYAVLVVVALIGLMAPYGLFLGI